MLTFLIRCFIGALFTFNLFADTDLYPTETAMDSTGQYVYCIWNKFDTDISAVQTNLSTDYGVTWQNPTSTPANGGTPNLSDTTKNSTFGEIAVSLTGEYVYAIWRCLENNSNYIIQTAFSSDYGVTWQYPTTTPADGPSPNLSDNGKDAFTPEISTDSTGQYVYAVWCRNSASMIIVQTAFSSDFGVTWQNPTTTTGDGGTPNLSDNNGSAYDCMIKTDLTGQYVYAIWTRANGTDWIIQTVKSSDFGVTWQKPTSTPADGGSPNLSNNGRTALNPCLTLDSTGQFLNVTWQRYDSGYIIQTVRSTNYGITWINPTSTTGDGGVPNLSNNGDNAQFAHISVDSLGENVFVIWYIEQAGNKVVQIASSSDYGATWINPVAINPQVNEKIGAPVGPTINTALSKKYEFVVMFNPLVIGLNSNAVVLASGIYLEDNYAASSKNDLLKKQYVNGIYWGAVGGAQSYRVYEGSMGNKVYDGTALQYFDQQIFLKREKTYLITWLDSEFVESNPSQIVIP